jgi:hypothetical protein
MQTVVQEKRLVIKGFPMKLTRNPSFLQQIFTEVTKMKKPQLLPFKNL